MEFKKAYELFSTEIEVMKKLKCRSVNTSHLGKGIPFSLAIIYFLLQGIAWIGIYIAVLSLIGVQYEMTVDNVLYIPSLVFLFLEMSIFPNIFLRIIKIDVLLDEKSAEDLMNDGALGPTSPTRYKRSEDFVSEPFPSISSTE